MHQFDLRMPADDEREPADYSPQSHRYGIPPDQSHPGFAE